MNGHTRTSSDAPREASFRTKWMVAIGESNLPPTTRLVGWALATWMDLDGRCFPKRTEIARRAGVSLKIVKRCLKELWSADYLYWTTGKGPGNPNRYQGLMGVAGTPFGTVEDYEKGVVRAEKGVDEDHKTVPAAHDLGQEVKGSFQEEEARATTSPSPNGDSPSREPEGGPPPWANIGWMQYLEDQKAKRTEEKQFLAGDPDSTIAQAEPEEAST